MVALQALMRERFAAWREDLPQQSGWPVLFQECPAPAFDRIPADLEIADDALVWPGRRGELQAGAPDGAHVCRAFDGIAPEDVRVVVLGQDPYPSVAQATGRAFEDGAWRGGRPQSLARSLKPLMLAAFATRDDFAGLFRAGSWPQVRRLIEDGHLEFPEITDYFDALVGQGVLFVNAAWTHTRSSDIGAHLSLWQPVLYHLLQKLARDAQAPLLFLLLGKKAQARFDASGAEAEARGAGTWDERVGMLALPHPRDAQFFRQNPWSRANQLLVGLGGQPLDWWPLQV